MANDNLPFDAKKKAELVPISKLRSKGHATLMIGGPRDGMWTGAFGEIIKIPEENGKEHCYTRHEFYGQRDGVFEFYVYDPIFDGGNLNLIDMLVLGYRQPPLPQKREHNDCT